VGVSFGSGFSSAIVDGEVASPSGADAFDSVVAIVEDGRDISEVKPVSNCLFWDVD
jgi:hypothetical protein